MIPVDDGDTQIRLAAFDHVKRLSEFYDPLPARRIAEGFVFEGQRILLTSRPRGIFKPKQMRYILSVKTVFPRPGRKTWYDDQEGVHQQIYGAEESIEYAFMGDDPNNHDNRGLREASELRLPLLYFVGVAPQFYKALFPAFISEWDPRKLKVRIEFGLPEGKELSPPLNPMERRYALRTVKLRLHQSSFREAVLTAYNGRCALSGLPVRRLLDAAHIIADRDPQLGQPVVTNGLPLSKIHHAAFDAHLIGVDPDYRMHIAERLLVQEDGPLLETLKKLHNETIKLPVREADRPDRDRLAQRFEEFKNAS